MGKLVAAGHALLQVKIERDVELGLRPWFETQTCEHSRYSALETGYGPLGPAICDGEFDPGSGRTLAAHLRHASRTGAFPEGEVPVADG